MNHQDALDAIAAIVDTHHRGAAVFGAEPDTAMTAIRQILAQAAADAQPTTGALEARARWVAEVRAGARVAEEVGGEIGHPLRLVLQTAARFVEEGSNLGGSMLPLRIKSLARAVIGASTHDTPGAAVSLQAELDARYCPKCGHPNVYDRGEGCTMPVLKGTTTPIAHGQRGVRCGCTYRSGPAPAGPAN
jgi:hypothetical protein